VASWPTIPLNSKQLWHPSLLQHEGIKVVDIRPIINPVAAPSGNDKRIVVAKNNIFLFLINCGKI